MKDTCNCFGNLTGAQSTFKNDVGYECCDFCGRSIPGQGFSVRPIFAWYDLWVGAFWDQHRRRLYVLPVPCAGIVIQFPPRR